MKNMIGYPDHHKTGGQDRSTEQEADMLWKVIAGVLTFEWRIYMPEALHNQVISLFHHNPGSGHFGDLRTAELVYRDGYWLSLDTTIRKYVTG
jgi:hypothetical protein